MWTGEALNIVGERQSQELAKVLVYAADTGMLWDQYGIVGDVLVSKLSSLIIDLLIVILQAIHISIPLGGYLQHDCP